MVVQWLMNGLLMVQQRLVLLVMADSWLMAGPAVVSLSFAAGGIIIGLMKHLLKL